MKAYLIDPQEREIRQVDYDGDYKSIYRLLDIDTFTAVELNDKRDVVYVDDEGLLKDPVYFFTVEGYGQPLAGKGLVLGTDGEGETVEPTLSLETLTQMVGWKRLTVTGFESWEGWSEHPVFGKTWVVGQTAKFGERDEGETE